MKSDCLGAIIAITSAILSNLGVNVQKKSHTHEEKRPEHERRSYIHRPAWWIGMIMIILGSLGDFFALGFASQTIVASLGGGSTIFANIVFARFWLKQRLFFTDICGVALVTIGVICLAAASVKEESYTVNQLFELMQAPQFIIYTMMTTGFVMLLMLRVKRSKAPALRSIPIKSINTEEDGETETETETETDGELEKTIKNEGKMKSKSEKYQTKAFLSASTSPDHNFPSPIVHDTLYPSDADPDLHAVELGESSTVITSSRDKMIKDNGITKERLLIEKLVIDPKLPLYWAAISGTIGAQSVLLAKCVMEMIFVSIGGDNQFCYIGTYVLILGMIATLLTQTHTLNLATMTGDTMSAFPVFQAFWICISNINGLVFFQQVHLFNTFQWIMFPSAMSLVILGITLIAKHEKYMTNNVKYSVAMPIQLSSPRQHNIVAQSFQFTVLTPQEKVGLSYEDEEDENKIEFGLNDDCRNICKRASMMTKVTA